MVAIAVDTILGYCNSYLIVKVWYKYTLYYLIFISILGPEGAHISELPVTQGKTILFCNNLFL